jgi:AraC-like DNA-binding protein
MARTLVPDDLFTRVLRARRRVRDAYDEPLSVASLASTAQLSPFHFLRVYTAAFGETPGHDLARIRLSRARELLARGGSVTEACFAVGFSSLGSFSARFKREFGITPRAFQRAARMVANAPGQLVTVCVPFCFAEHFAPEGKIAILEKSAEGPRGTALPVRNVGASQARRTPGENR